MSNQLLHRVPRSILEARPHLSRRAYELRTTADLWEEIWEVSSYYERVSQLLEDAEESAVFVGWQIDSRILLKNKSNQRASVRRQGRASESAQFEAETFKEKILRLCKKRPKLQFYFLIWDHAYFYVFEREFWQGRVWDDIHPRVHFVFDNKHPFGGCHHEKITWIDGKVALCGGIDLCDDRWDSPLHLYSDIRRSLLGKKEKHGPYHDLGVQVTGPICETLQSHIEVRWKSLSSIPFPSNPSRKKESSSIHSGHRVYVSRTFTEIDRRPKKPIFVREIEFLFRDLIQSAEKQIILEGQYYWSEAFNDLLIAKMMERMGKTFEIVLILSQLQNIHSWTKYMTAFELGLLRRLKHAADFTGTQLTLGSPFSVCVLSKRFREISEPKPIYIHSKILLIDDRYLGIGSANFATRAFRVDTELHLTFEAVTLKERQHLRDFEKKLRAHWGFFESSHSTSITSSVIFRNFSPNLELNHLSQKFQLLRKVNLRIFFDPEIPWFYFIKLKYFRSLSRSKKLAKLSLLLIWIASVGVLIYIDRLYYSSSFLALFYIFVLTTVWFFPIPFVTISILSVFQLESDRAIRLSLFSFWIASFIGYNVSRSFPKWVEGWIRRDQSQAFVKMIRERKFSNLLLFLFNPFLNIRSKILVQGLSWIPFPWFFLATELVLASALYLVLKGALMVSSFQLTY